MKATSLLLFGILAAGFTSCAPGIGDGNSAAPPQESADPTGTMPVHVAETLPPLLPSPTPIGGGGEIAFSSNRDGNFEIYRMLPDGSGQTRLTRSSSDDFNAEYSPDGQLLAYLASDPPNAEFRFVSREGEDLGVFGPGTQYISLSPDGNSAVLVVFTEAGERDILRVDFDGEVQLLTTDPAGDVSPAWSPDGGTIAFVSGRDGYAKIYLMDPDGANQRRMMDSSMAELEPAWSPDGKMIAFVSGDDAGTQIYLVNVDGTGLVRVTNGAGFNEHPTWSPDGTMLAFWSNRTGSGQIYRTGIDGSDLTRLTNNDFHDENPDWSP